MMSSLSIFGCHQSVHYALDGTILVQHLEGKEKNVRILKRKEVEKELHVAVVVDAESSSKQQEALKSELPMNEIADLVVILDVDEERITGTGVRKEIEKSLEDQNKL